ncbi:methylthioribose transporter-like [Amphiura filiformis]|uniref:methylthioribose transporter-like n=1 Tax=Amphiura filiformis TaxID=82378 RepID=UPI003B2210D4
MNWLRDVGRAVRRKKHVSSTQQPSILVRCLSTADLSFVGIGCMLGSGVYILTGEVAAEMAGPAAIISFLIAGIVALFSALCYTECATRFPETGASYLYAYVSLGELIGFLIGWNAIIIRILAVSFVSRGWSAYFDNVIGARVLNFTMDVLLDGAEWEVPLVSSYPDILAGVVSLSATVLVALGTELSAKTGRVFVLINIATVLMVIAVAFVYADYSHLVKHGGFAPMGYGGIIKGAAAGFAGYSGFEAIAFAAEEAKDPKKGLPISVGLSFVTAILVYMGGAFAITVLADWQNINAASPFVSAFEAVDAKWMSIVIAVGALCSMTGGLIACAYCFARAIFVMGRDGLIPAIFARTSTTSHTPTVATMFGGIISVIASIFVNFVALIEFLSLMIFVEFVIVAMACILMRYNPTRDHCGKERNIEHVVQEQKQRQTCNKELSGEINNDMTYQSDNDQHSTSSSTDVQAPRFASEEITPAEMDKRRPTVTAIIEGHEQSCEYNKDLPAESEVNNHDVANGRSCNRFSASINNESIGELTPLLGSLPPTSSQILCQSEKKPGRLLWSSDNPVKTVLSSLLVFIVSTIVIVWIVSYKMEEIRGDNDVLTFILMVAAMLAVTGCVPLFMLKQYTDEIPFKVPLMPFIPLLSIVSNIILMMRFEPLTWIELGVWTAIGLVVYFVYGIRHSKEAGILPITPNRYTQASKTYS